MTTIVFKSEDLTVALNAVKNCMSKDSTRAILNSVQVEILEGTALFVGCDGRKLAKVEIGYMAMDKTDVADASAFMIPAASVKDILANAKRTRFVTFKIGSDKTECAFDQNSATSFKSADGNYPKWRQVMPAKEDSKLELCFDPVLLGDLLKSIPAQKGKATCRMHISDAFSPMRITAEKFESVIMPMRMN